MDAEIVSVPTRPARRFLVAVPAVLPGLDPGRYAPACQHLRWRAAAFEMSMRTLPALHCQAADEEAQPASLPAFTITLGQKCFRNGGDSSPGGRSREGVENHKSLEV